MRVWWLLLLLAGCGSEPAKKGVPQSQCGNGQLNPGEACDPYIEEGQPGACPISCVASACETATMEGNPLSCTARCVVAPVACADGDGCCPRGCDSSSDGECLNTCGDGIVNGPETCDGNCPTSCGDSCGGLALTGGAETCSAQCVAGTPVGCVSGDGCCPVGCSSDSDNDCSPAAECGNGVVDEGESCDGNCATSCAASGACRVARISGDAQSCDVACVEFDVTSCVSGDGCCPGNCSAQSDSDCSGTCGNSVIDAGETCDGLCPTSCAPPNACTSATLRGSAANCTAACEFDPVTACVPGDGCCPSGCSLPTDTDCSCVPKTCAQLGAECGSVLNGCGQVIQCPSCSGGEVCSGNTCVAPGDGGVGSLCSNDLECDSGLTCDVGFGFCTTACDPFSGLCPSGSSCEVLVGVTGQTFVCARVCRSAADCEGSQMCNPPLLPISVENICY